jgi:hypothetical protein
MVKGYVLFEVRTEFLNIISKVLTPLSLLTVGLKWIIDIFRDFAFGTSDESCFDVGSLHEPITGAVRSVEHTTLVIRTLGLRLWVPQGTWMCIRVILYFRIEVGQFCMQGVVVVVQQIKRNRNLYEHKWNRGKKKEKKVRLQEKEKNVFVVYIRTVILNRCATSYHLCREFLLETALKY